MNGDGSPDDLWGGLGPVVVLIQQANNPPGTTTTWTFTENAGTGNSHPDVTGISPTVTLSEGLWQITATATAAGATSATATCWLEVG